MKKRIRKAVRKLRQGKIRSAVRSLVTPHHTETRIETARRVVATYLRKLHGNRIAYGPFAGVRLPEHSYWGGTDLSAKILGTYEAHIAEALVGAAHPDGMMVDLGSADGYFAIGAARMGLFAEYLCFERSEKGQRVLSETASANDVGEQIRIFGEATEAALLAAVPERQTGVVLCDVEGAEFTLFSDRLLKHLSGMQMMIELHEFLVTDGAALRDDLIARAGSVFEVKVVGSASPDIARFRELDGFDDDHRLLAFSEGREVATNWLMLRPKTGGFV